FPTSKCILHGGVMQKALTFVMQNALSAHGWGIDSESEGDGLRKPGGIRRALRCRSKHHPSLGNRRTAGTRTGAQGAGARDRRYRGGKGGGFVMTRKLSSARE